MPEITITREASRLVGHVAGQPEAAELVFSHRGGRLVAEHTFAPDSLRGTGVALALVERLVADARAAGERIVPVCPYVRAQARKHPEWADVIGPAPAASQEA
jgi:predicted GNAT family acetyltransferase